MEDSKLDKFISLVFWNRHAYSSPDQRWLGDGDIITFDVFERRLTNTEFAINNNPHHLIWFSQFSDVYLQLEKFDLVVSEITLKNGDSKFPFFNNNVSEFEKLVKDKEFKVIVNPDGPVAKFNGNIPCATYEECAKYIKDLVEKGELEKAASYLTPSIEYGLVEV